MNQEAGGNETLFYDTYALYEVALASNNYKKFSQGFNVITTIMNLYELYYTFLKEDKKETAEELLNNLKNNCVEINEQHIKNASIFRLRQIKRRVSFIDCLGYAIAKDLGIKFLTGDKEFENLPNVLFVKK